MWFHVLCGIHISICMKCFVCIYTVCVCLYVCLYVCVFVCVSMHVSECVFKTSQPKFKVHFTSLWLPSLNKPNPFWGVWIRLLTVCFHSLSLCSPPAPSDPSSSGAAWIKDELSRKCSHGDTHPNIHTERHMHTTHTNTHIVSISAVCQHEDMCLFTRPYFHL